MSCWQILPGRRWCRLRPFLVVLALAACLFYQTLTPLRTRRYLPAVGNGVLSNKVVEGQHRTHKEVSEKQVHCFLSSNNLQAWKETEDAIFKHFRSQTRAVILYILSSGNKQDLQLYRHILAQHNYVVTVLEDGKLSRHEIPNQELSSWDLLICLSSRKADHENCLNIVESHRPMLLQKANVLPSIQHLLCRKEGLCQIVRTFPDLYLPVALPACPESNMVSLHIVKPHDDNEPTLTQMLYQPITNVQQYQIPTEIDNKGAFKIQDLSLIIKVYVLVTSLTPLRAFIHSTGVVSYAPKKKYFSVKLQAFFETIFTTSSPQQALDDMKEAINKLLLITEVLSEAPSSGPKYSSQCTSCFQMLTFDIGFSPSMHPIVLEVHENFDFPADEDSTFQDQTVKEILLGDTFRMISSNQSSSKTFFKALQNVYRSGGSKNELHEKELELCLTLEELNPLISFIQEFQNLGQFEVLFPSTIPKSNFLLHDLYRMVNPGEKFGSVLAAHWVLSNLLEHLQVINRAVHTNRPGGQNKEVGNVSSMTARWSSLRSSYSEKHSIKTRASYPFSENREDLRFLNMAKEIHCSHDKDTLPHVKQIFTTPHLDLNPNFDPKIKEYYSEVPFDVVTIMIRAEPANCQCEVHLDEKNGPSVANYPLGLGINRVNVLVIDVSQSVHEVVSIYRLIIFREDRPSLPLFNDFMVCGFVQVLFIGDSTNRGMMYYLIERVNKTLQEWQKAHDMKFYDNINERKTFISYSYYPQFWISVNQRPTFEKALEQLLLRSQPLQNTGQTILVVGGVQWLNFNHLHIIQKVLKRANLSNIQVVIKSLGMGFHLPVNGVHYLSPVEVQNLWNENQAILNTAKQYGYEVVDTFIITMGRYKEFLQGKCGCHFHEVVKSKTSEGSSPMAMRFSKPYALGKHFNNQSNLVKLQAYASNSQSPYHVRGPINQVYSEILLSRICANDRNVAGL
ncbi:cadherin-like and PC-esterase domain-containing protein 1 isoform X3 [Sceloporus undulatus]|uniref:cadherin-like and PC-esterase domain-containing protein 1 isoform X3 n=1 Tax=Sceloporus undulatus TaxID=8520 RepID=UPI001C4BDDAA|nr:cadherin-like and PC-esterase domain-containing protein 1 isoform X3 [Sceloporus undulatus]